MIIHIKIYFSSIIARYFSIIIWYFGRKQRSIQDADSKNELERSEESQYAGSGNFFKGPVFYIHLQGSMKEVHRYYDLIPLSLGPEVESDQAF
jgi:hypothetical protein